MILTSNFFLTGPCCAALEYCLFFVLPHSTWLEVQQIDHPAMCKPKFKFISRWNRIWWTYSKQNGSRRNSNRRTRPKPYGLSWGYMVAAKLFFWQCRVCWDCHVLSRELEVSIVGCPLTLCLTQSRLNQPCTSLVKLDSNIVPYIGKFLPGKTLPKFAPMYCAKNLPDLISPHE